MNAFARATAAMLADRNIGADAEYYIAPFNTRISVRVVLSRPTEAVTGFQLAAAVDTAVITCSVADFPEAPGKDGFFDIGGEVYRVRSAERDETRTAWRVECAPC